MRYGFGNGWVGDLGYRFKGLIGTDPNGAQGDYHSRVNYYNHVIQAGVSYQFGENGLDPAMMPTGDGVDYVSVFGGWTIEPHAGAVYNGYVYDIEFDSGFTVGVAAGSYLVPGIRGEVELAYANYSAESYTYDPNSGSTVTGDINQITGLVNVWKDIYLTDRISVYAGAGLGIGYIDTDVEHAQETGGGDIGLAGQFGAGMRYYMTDRAILDGSYRFRAVPGVLFEGSASSGDNHAQADFFTHTLQVGVTYLLGDGEMPEHPTGAPGNSYVSLFGGAVIPEDAAVSYDSYVYDTTFDTGFTAGIAVGTEIMDNTRGELELSYVRYSGDTYTYYTGDADDTAHGDQNFVFLQANVWRDFNTGGRISPYVGGGVGMAFTDNYIDFDSGDIISGNDVVLAGQAGIGLRTQVTDNVALDFGYRFKAAMDDTMTDSPDGDYHGQSNFFDHVLQAGVT